MTRKKVLALAGMLALGSLAIATEASARGGMGGMGHAGGMGMGHMGGMGSGHVGGMGMGHWGGMGVAHAGGMGHWSGMGWHGHVGHLHPFFHHRRFFAFGFGSYYGYPDYDYGDCWQWQHVPTRWGWHWRHINVCDGSYY